MPRCQIYVWSHLTSLTPSELFDKAKRASSGFELGFSVQANQTDAQKIYFIPNRDLFHKNLEVQPSTTALEFICHYEAVLNAEHSAISICSPDSITGLLRLCGRKYYLTIYDGNFTLLTEDACDFQCNNRTKRFIDSASNVPKYYSEYFGGEKKRYLELIFIADNSIYKKYDEDEKKINDRITSIANVVNSLYAPLNIRVALVWADIWKESNRIDVTTNADKTLENFMNYRKTILDVHPHDNAQLITDTKFGQVIGKGYRGTMCSYDYSGGVIVDHSDHESFVGGTVAHEIGHNFGMDHDMSSCHCPTDTCVMAAVSNNINASTYFSDCSLEYLSHAFERGVDYCLNNVPEMIFGGAKCGNGILEIGEECDCGSLTKCPNKCCIANKCKLAENAQCANGECCDTSICKPKPFAQICRPSTDDCDLAEYCDGHNPNCPPDFFVQNGHECPNSSNNYCYEGICGSKEQQCHLIWGTKSSNLPECYSLNTYESMSGNCGYNPKTGVYLRCSESNVGCGRLQCQSDLERPLFGDSSSVQYMKNYVLKENGQQATCLTIQTTYIGNKKWPDPGMVKNGANCGIEKMCINAECKNRTEFLQTVPRCQPVDCNGKGICNNVGNCHCENGYGGIGCDIPGYGGSVNSGPANDKIFNPGFILLYFVILLFIIFAGATYHYKKKRDLWLHKIIWKFLVKHLNIRSILVPVRKAPPAPKSTVNRPNFNLDDAWGDSNIPGTLHINAANPLYITTNVSLTNTNVGIHPVINQWESRNKMERPASNSSNDSEEQQRENMKLIRSKHPFSSAMPPPVPPHRIPHIHSAKIPNKKLQKAPSAEQSSKNTSSNVTKDENEKSVTSVSVKELAAKFSKQM